MSSHVGIRVNKKADLSAKLALSSVRVGVFQILNISTNTVGFIYRIKNKIMILKTQFLFCEKPKMKCLK